MRKLLVLFLTKSPVVHGLVWSVSVQNLTLARYLICVSEVMEALPPSSSLYCTFPRWRTLAMMFNSSCKETTQGKGGGGKNGQIKI